MGELETSDQIDVTIDDKGVIHSLHLGDLNSFSETSTIHVSTEKIQKSLADLSAAHGWGDEYTILDQTLTKSHDDQYVVMSRLDHTEIINGETKVTMIYVLTEV